MYRIAAFMLLGAVILISLTGCFDAVELNDVEHVSIIGIDRGVSDKWRITFQLPSTAGEGEKGGMGGGGQAGGGFSYKTLTIDAPSFFAGLEMANASIPRKLELSHTQLLVFSEELARSGMVGEFIAPIVRGGTIRFSSNVVISRGSAEEFVKSFKPFIGKTISREIADLMEQANESGYFTNLTLYDLYDCIKSTYHQPIAILGAVNKGENFKENGERWGTEFNIAGDYYAGDIPRKDGNETEILGLAIFDGDRMVGKLTGFESRLLSIAKGIFKRGIFTIQDPKSPDYIIPVDTRQARSPEFDILFEGTKPIIHLKIQIEGDILAIQSRINYEDPKLQPILQAAIERFIKDGLDRTINKTQELNCDVFKFGQKAVRHFGTIGEWEAYNWNSHYKEAEITTEVKFSIRRTGGLVESSQIIFSGEMNK